MISVLRTRPNSLTFRYLQLSAAIFSIIVVAVFLRFSLQANSTAFRHDFERQSFLELSRGDIFIIARKLAAVAKGNQISCLIATKSDIIFFEERKGNCRAGLFRTIEVVKEKNQKIEIKFTLGLQEELMWGFALFFGLQVFLVGGIWVAQRHSVISEHSHDIELASLARQVGHDIRSPLAIISQPNIDPNLSERALERMKEMVNRLLGEPEAEPFLFVSLQRLIKESVEEKMIESSGRVNIVINGSNEAIYAGGSVFLWRRVISNLLNNSIEASRPKGEIEIQISSSNGVGSVRIADRGHGIPALQIEKLGEVGFTFGKTKGHGLGLSSAFGFMRSIGGRVEIESTEGSGTTVSMHFPVEIPEVVLIDDDHHLAQIWRVAAKKRAIKFHYYSCPEAFLNNFEKVPTRSVIYLDVTFPDSVVDLEDFGRRLSKVGYRNIFLATGHPKGQIKKWSWVSGVIGKEPPFL